MDIVKGKDQGQCCAEAAVEKKHYFIRQTDREDSAPLFTGRQNIRKLGGALDSQQAWKGC